MILQKKTDNMKRLFLFASLFFPIVLLAQQPKPPVKKGQIESEEIVIEKNRAITLPEAERNFEKINITGKKPDATAQPYQFTDRNLKLADLNPRFRILQMNQETTPAPTGNFVKAGLGNYNSFYAEAFLGASRNDRFSWNVRAKNLAFGRGPVNGANSATLENMLAGQVRLVTEPITATAALEYTRDRYYFYGTRDRRDRSDIRQVISGLGLLTSFTNNIADAKLDYKLNFNIRNTTDAYNVREFEAAVNLDTKYRITDNLRVLVPTDLYFTRLQDDGSLSRNVARVKPQLQYRNETFTVTAGLNLVSQNDTTPNLSSINLYPVAEAQVTIAEAVTVFGGITGDMQRNTFRQIVDENPFVNSRLQIFNTSKSSEIYGGLKRQLGGALAFDVRASFARYRNMYFYVNSPRDSSRFDLIYNGDFTGVFNLSTELSYDAGKRFRISGKADFYRYNVENVEQPWHRPTFTATVVGRFAATDKLFFNTEVYYLGGIQARAPVTNRAVSLDAIADLNLRGEYLFLEKFSAYLSLNNLLSSQYQRFLYYPNRGFTAMIGGSYSF
ncbi:MAG: hypothetical protein MUD08_03170 [Cytophagales bacterium]|nr:hypothetical protein [Cytophagales bacterium]